jgi:hypothetical protein
MEDVLEDLLEDVLEEVLEDVWVMSHQLCTPYALTMHSLCTHHVCTLGVLEDVWVMSHQRSPRLTRRQEWKLFVETHSPLPDQVQSTTGRGGGSSSRSAIYFSTVYDIIYCSSATYFNLYAFCTYLPSFYPHTFFTLVPQVEQLWVYAKTGKTAVPYTTYRILQYCMMQYHSTVLQ